MTEVVRFNDEDQKKFKQLNLSSNFKTFVKQAYYEKIDKIREVKKE